MALFFRTPKHRIFNYQPLYYDERKEALDEKIENARKRNAGKYIPGDTVRGGFKKIKYNTKRSKGMNSIIRYITIIAFAIFIIALIHFTKFFDFFMNL